MNSRCFKALIAIYKKGIKDDLSAAEKKALKKLNENW
jgi:hypothetical protein